jgi:eukaryotic-like serine/threonine-protein kinase
MFPSLKNYTVICELGFGGMATVYEAIDNRLNRTVALKILHPHLCSNSTATEGFKREALAAARMDHPNIVRIFDYVCEGQYQYIVMEYIPGQNLDCILKRKSVLSFNNAAEIMWYIACALAETHGFGIIHNDIKPANIMIHKRGNVLLSDFGLAHHIFDSRLTINNSVIGTPSFMSPEQLCGKELTPASDIYSWAITFYCLIAGKLPYSSQQFPDIITEIKQGSITFNNNIDNEIPSCYYNLLQRCLCSNPLERIKDGITLKKILSNCRGELSLKSNVDQLTIDIFEPVITRRKNHFAKSRINTLKKFFSTKRYQ